MDIQKILGLTAGLVGFTSYVIYLFSIYKKETVPNSFTWLVLSILGSLTCVTYYLQGADNTIWVPISYTLGSVIIFFSTLKYGERKIGGLEIFSIAAITLTLAIWYITNSSFAALICSIIIDFFGLLPTVKKTYFRPYTESKLAWQLAFLATIFNLLALEDWQIKVSIYPLYLTFVDGGMTLLIYQNKFRKSRRDALP